MRRALPLVLVVAVFALVPLAGASGDDEAAFTTRVNGERTGRGIAALAERDDLVAVARRHAEEMARRGRVGHYGNLATEVGGWQKVGENVGAGGSVDEVHRLFMASSTHRTHIVDPSYLDVGVGTVWSGGRIWVSEIFRAPSGAPAAPPPTRAAPAPRASRSAPRSAVAAVATQPAPPPPPPTAPPPPPPPPVTTTVIDGPVNDFRGEERLVRARLVGPPVELVAAPIGRTDGHAETLLVLAATLVAGAALTRAFHRRTSR